MEDGRRRPGFASCLELVLGRIKIPRIVEKRAVN